LLAIGLFTGIARNRSKTPLFPLEIGKWQRVIPDSMELEKADPKSMV